MRRECRPVTPVLVVDGTGSLAAQLQERLGAFLVLTAQHGDRALAEIERRRPQLVVIDARGAAALARLCTRLRTDPRYGNPVTVLVTTGGRPVELLGLVDECVDGHLLDVSLLADRIRAALRRTAEMRDSSPLTGLPGNTAITAALQARLAAPEPVALLYADLDNFKALNDHYGFVRGDEVIATLAGILRAEMADHDDVFVGHVGGDDFVLLTRADRAEELAQSVLDRFAVAVPGFYDAEAWERGGIEVADRRGQRRFFPAVSLSIGIASNWRRPIADYRELVELATEMKSYAKTQDGNVFAADRRTGPVQPSGSPPQHRAALRRSHRSPDRLRGQGRPRRGLHRLAGLATSAMFAMVVLLSTTAAGLAHTAVPGDPLWPAKLRVEQLQLRLAGTAERELALRVEFASRRLNELATLSAGQADPALVERTADELDRELDELADRYLPAGRKPGSPASAGLSNRLEVALEQQALLLADLREKACSPDRWVDPARVCQRLDLAASSAVTRLAEASEQLGSRPVAETPALSAHDGHGRSPSSGHDTRSGSNVAGGHSAAEPPASPAPTLPPARGKPPAAQQPAQGHPARPKPTRAPAHSAVVPSPRPRPATALAPVPREPRQHDKPEPGPTREPEPSPDQTREPKPKPETEGTVPPAEPEPAPEPAPAPGRQPAPAAPDPDAVPSPEPEPERVPGPGRERPPAREEELGPPTEPDGTDEPAGDPQALRSTATRQGDRQPQPPPSASLPGVPGRQVERRTRPTGTCPWTPSAVTSSGDTRTRVRGQDDLVDQLGLVPDGQGQ